MKLSVINSTPKPGRVAGLTATNEAPENFHDRKDPLLKIATRQFSCFESGIPRRPLEWMSQVSTVSQGGK
jgi:hypothetical protein